MAAPILTPTPEATGRSGSPAPRRARRHRRREALTGYLLISPQALGFTLFVLVPLVAIVVLSFTHTDLRSGRSEAAGWDNYRQLLTEDPTFWRSVAVTGVFALGLVAINVGLSLGLALVLYRRPPGAGLFLTLAFLSVVTSQAAWALVWRFLLQGEGGGVNELLSLVGITGPNWLFEAKPALAAVIVVAALKTVGLKAVIFLAALRNIPSETLEAARLDGASEWRLIRHVVLPLIAPTTLVVVLITFIGSFQVFDYIQLMTHGGPSHATSVLAFYLYEQAFELFQAGYASAIAVVLFGLTLLLVAAQWWARRKWVHSE
ncbi:carbohydrate ABC transporter permease [Prauserella muralis]|uniref:carbohydrate ABC transporter permease n=1 Tax=Prauserella muralis TaxID=588067 RepID=UPI0011ABD083|nr:sugar ABC transporter permease [Prauserella muralis]TWE22257.1 carbohydrate ABC transporter membrane protein 1 (CUT1 family) [Prauserella muralis]